jgi:hypothetical protein
MAEDLQTAPHTVYIQLLSNNQKRKHEIEAERKQMEKQQKNCKTKLIPAVERLRSYSVNYWTEMSTMVVIQSVGVDLISMIGRTVRFYQISVKKNPHKFLHESWKEYNPMDEGSLSSKIYQMIDLSDYVRQNPSDWDGFWMNKTVHMINKKVLRDQGKRHCQK